jgi:hypothetical protein
LVDEHKSDEETPLHYEDGIPIFEGEAERADREHRAEKRKQAEYNERQISIQRGLLFTQIALLIFGVCGTVISSYQAYTSRISADAATRAAKLAADSFDMSVEQFERTMRQTIHQTAAQIQSSAAAQGSTKVASDTLANAERQFRLEERPYVWPNPSGGYQISDTNANRTIFHQNGDKIDVGIVVQILNSGRSPATDVVPTLSEIIVGPAKTTDEIAARYTPKYSDATARDVLAGNTALTVAGDTTHRLSPKEMGFLQDGSWTMYVVGGVEYRDVFSPKIPPYETKYCYRINMVGLTFRDCGIEIK